MEGSRDITGKILDLQIAQAIGKLGPECFAAAADENRRIAFGLVFVEDAIANHAVCDWMPIRSLVSTLTDWDEVVKLVNEVRPESIFHNNANAVGKLVDFLEHWRVKGFFSNQDNILQASHALKERMIENTRFLQDYYK